jgi:hypothetical protein
LTERARALESSLTQAVREVNAAASRDFTDEEAITCMRLVARLIENLETERIDRGDQHPDLDITRFVGPRTS